MRALRLHKCHFPGPLDPFVTMQAILFGFCATFLLRQMTCRTFQATPISSVDEKDVDPASNENDEFNRTENIAALQNSKLITSMLVNPVSNETDELNRTKNGNIATLQNSKLIPSVTFDEISDSFGVERPNGEHPFTIIHEFRPLGLFKPFGKKLADLVAALSHPNFPFSPANVLKKLRKKGQKIFEKSQDFLSNLHEIE